MFTRESLLSFLVALISSVSLEGLFSLWQEDVNAKALLSLKTVFEDELISVKLHDLSKRLVDQKEVGLVDCLRVKNSSMNFKYESSVERCENGPIQIMTRDGRAWIVEYSVAISIYQTITKWLLRVLFFGFFLVTSFCVLKFLKKRTEEKKQAERDHIELQRIAAKTKHDIAGPMSALSIIIAHRDFPEKFRTLAKEAMARTLHTSENLTEFQKRESQKNTFCNPYDCIEQVIREKQTIFPKKEVKLVSDVQVEVAVRANGAELCVILSNILNNSFEAGASEIKIFSDALEDGFHITLQDNGPGFPSEVLSQFGKGAMSFGKEMGSGIGLSSALESLQKYKGTLEIENHASGGAQVKVSMQKANT